jgi:hypothetical protein
MGQTTTINTGVALFVDTDISKVFIYDNRFNQEILNNPTGGTLTYPTGTVMGRVSASGKLIPFTSAAVDGSQNIVGILNDAKTVPATSDANCFICVSGDVDPTLLVFQGADTLNTVIGGVRVRDLLARQGIKLTATSELTKFDNS